MMISIFIFIAIHVIQTVCICGDSNSTTLIDLFILVQIKQKETLFSVNRELWTRRNMYSMLL